MRKADIICILSCAVALSTACSSSSSNSTNDGGSPGTEASTPMGDDATSPSGDDGASGPPMGLPEASITCMGAADCGGAGHACCFSMTTFSTMCVTGTCGSDYTQCVSMDSECPAGDQCIPSPLGAGVHYCAPGDGGATGEAGVNDSGGDASSDGPTE
jgi:hypothetical protein